MEKEINEEKNPSGWFFAEWISIIGTFLVCFVFLFYQNQAQSCRSDAIYQSFQEEIRSQNERTDQMNTQFQLLISNQSSRTDKLYEMFYEVVKEKK